MKREIKEGQRKRHWCVRVCVYCRVGSSVGVLDVKKQTNLKAKNGMRSQTEE